MASELDVDQSYKTIEWMTLSMQKVGAKPKLLGMFLFEYTKNMPAIIDAVMTLVQPEHRGVAADLLRASGKMSREVLLWQTKK